MHDIPTIDKYTKGTMEWNPIIRSVKIIQRIGRKRLISCQRIY